MIDFKFGSGVRVLALYCDGDEDIINAQLLFYAAAARHSFPEFFTGVEDIVLAIVQPMAIELDAEMISAVTVSGPATAPTSPPPPPTPPTSPTSAAAQPRRRRVA